MIVATMRAARACLAASSRSGVFVGMVISCGWRDGGELSPPYVLSASLSLAVLFRAGGVSPRAPFCRGAALPETAFPGLDKKLPATETGFDVLLSRAAVGKTLACQSPLCPDSNQIPQRSEMT